MRKVLPWRRMETWLVILISLHSYLVGIMLVFFSSWSAEFGGWEDPGTLFFMRQGGVFHLVVATGYLMEYFRHRSVSLMILAKSVAVVFLLSMSLQGGAWAVPFSALTDGLMLIVVIVVHRKAERLRATVRHRRKLRAREAGVI